MKKKRQPKFVGDEPLDRAHRELMGMKHKDLQTACVIRGMEPQQVVNSSDPDLANWFLKNYENGLDHTLIPIFNQYVEGELVSKGYKKGDIMLSPSLRLGYTKEFEDSTTVAPPKPKREVEGEVVKKSRGQKDEVLGVYKGTRKALTYECVHKGKSIEETIKIVMEAFPEAKEKSIKIWYRQKANGKKS